VPTELPPVKIPHPHVTVDADGSPVVEGSRVPVRRLFSWHRSGTTVETLLKRYPQLGPARIFDALAFAYDNLELVAADLARERELLAAAEQAGEAPPPDPKKKDPTAQAKLPFDKPK